MLAILFWIPTHILTFNMRYYDDYQAGTCTDNYFYLWLSRSHGS